VEDEPRGGRPAGVRDDDTNAVIVATLLDEDRRMTVREMEAECNIPKSSLHQILTEVLGKRKIAARWVPHFLNADQKAERMRVARVLLRRYRKEGDRFLERIITMDETWIRDFEPELKSQSNVWASRGEKRPQKVRRQQSKVKQMVVLAYDFQGIITSYKVPQGATMNAAMYKDFLQNNLRPKIRKNRPGLLEKGVIILHDNCRVHVARVIVDLLQKYGWEVLPHPPYSPDLSPCDYDLNPKLKEPMRGHRFQDIDELMARLTQEIWRLNRSKVLDGIQKLPERWTKCIELEGDYIEGF
jgi:histone-lysine N-methyltransferase SETMAR